MTSTETEAVAEPVKTIGVVHIRTLGSMPPVAFCGVQLAMPGRIPKEEITEDGFCPECVERWQDSL